MIDWTQSMQQSFEYYIVDPVTWRDIKRFDCVTDCTISRDAKAETRGSASIELTEVLGECYVRAYLIVLQDGSRQSVPLGTYLVQTPSESFDGMVKTIKTDAYTPLLELKENPPPLGYFAEAGSNVMQTAFSIASAHMRAPVVKTECDERLYAPFVANTNDTYLSYIGDLAAKANYTVELDELGRLTFEPKLRIGANTPVWRYDDSNSSILDPSISLSQDLYGIPNAVEIIYSNGADYLYVKVRNEDPSSPTSTAARGREILKREVNPAFAGRPSKEMLISYAKQRLYELSSVERTIAYKHGYCPVRLGDCVEMDYSRAGMTGIRAKVVSQSIECVPGTPVTEQAVYTARMAAIEKMKVVEV